MIIPFVFCKSFLVFGSVTFKENPANISVSKKENLEYIHSFIELFLFLCKGPTELSKLGFILTPLVYLFSSREELKVPTKSSLLTFLLLKKGPTVFCCVVL